MHRTTHYAVTVGSSLICFFGGWLIGHRADDKRVTTATINAADDSWASDWDVDNGVCIEGLQVQEPDWVVFKVDGAYRWHRIRERIIESGEHAGYVLADGRVIVLQRGENNRLVSAILANPK